RNGSYLAVRQLEQGVDAFRDLCEREGDRLKPSFPEGVKAEPADFIAAKMVGRWRDGSPLVRYPRYPATNVFAPGRPLSRASGGASAQSALHVPPPTGGERMLAASATSDVLKDN